MSRLAYTLLLAFVYLGLTGNLELLNIVMALLLGAGVTLLLVRDARPLVLAQWPGEIIALIRYIFLVGFDIAKSGIQTARIIIDPSLPIQPGIVAIPSGCDSDLATALSAHAITITPGELVVEIDDDGNLYTHELDATQAEQYAFEAQRLRRNLLRRIVT